MATVTKPDPKVKSGPSGFSLIRLFRLGFLERITLHIVLLLLLFAFILTLLMAARFREKIHQRENDSALTVYAAAANYLRGHYLSHRRRFVNRSLDFVLRERFMRLEGLEEGQVTHRPSQLFIYDPEGHVMYQYTEDPDIPMASNIDPSLLPQDHQLVLNESKTLIYVLGPLQVEDDFPGYVGMIFPTTIGSDIRNLYQELFVLCGLLILAATVFTVFFARSELRPIKNLTEAARRIHAGDMNVHIPVTTQDEVGELTETVNEMGHSLNNQIQLLKRMQEWTVKIGTELESEKLHRTLTALFSLMGSTPSCRLAIYHEKEDQLHAALDHGGDLLPVFEKDVLTHLAFDERWIVFADEHGDQVEEMEDAKQLAIPLLSGRHRIGVIRLGLRKDESSYDRDTLMVLQTLAQHASVAIDNAHLYEEIAVKERIEQEMNLARHIQQSMLPTDVPIIPEYEIFGLSLPALSVGGDYFDYVQLSEENWLFILGDVSGKGVPAALIMSILRSLFHTYSEFETNSLRMMHRVNRSISADLESDMFVTVAGILLKPELHLAYITRAGHEPIFHYCAKTQTVEQHIPPGAALGMLPADAFEDVLGQMKVELQPGDFLLLYTDGVTESQSRAGEEFDYDRLEAFVKKHAHESTGMFSEKLLDELKVWSDDQPQNDDITLLIVKRKGGS